jgi:regulator of protease activity HflC (stomatin/prohibitin superfamily)
MSYVRFRTDDIANLANSEFNASDRGIRPVDEQIAIANDSATSLMGVSYGRIFISAPLFWHVHDAEKAALAITHYREAIDRVAQTSLREMIGASMLASLLSERK